MCETWVCAFNKTQKTKNVAKMACPWKGLNLLRSISWHMTIYVLTPPLPARARDGTDGRPGPLKPSRSGCRRQVSGLSRAMPGAAPDMALLLPKLGRGDWKGPMTLQGLRFKGPFEVGEGAKMSPKPSKGSLLQGSLKGFPQSSLVSQGSLVFLPGFLGVS